MSRISGAVYTVNLQLGSSYGERKRKKKNPQEGGGGGSPGIILVKSVIESDPPLHSVTS